MIRPMQVHPARFMGALERTRTSTPVWAQHPECCASTNSATRADRRDTLLQKKVSHETVETGT